MGDLLHDSHTLILRQTEEASSGMSHAAIAWEENIARNTLSHGNVRQQVIHIPIAYVFLAKGIT